MKNDKDTAVAKADKLQNVIDERSADFITRLKEAGAQKDAEIQRQKEEIVELHKKLKENTQALDLYRQDSLRHDEQLRQARQPASDNVLPGESCL